MDGWRQGWPSCMKTTAVLRVEIYGKADCSPCEDAKALLRRLREELPFELVEVDIARDPALEARFRTEIPVVLVEGRKVLKLRFTEKQARRTIGRALASARRSASGRPADSIRGRRGLRLVLAALALVAVLAVPAYRAWDVWVEQPRADEAFDITRIRPVPAPDLGTETRGGKPFRLADHRGQVLFVNFWATWCPPCSAEMPSMLQLGWELQREYPGRFRMVAVSVDEGWDVVQQFFGGALPPGLLVTLDRTQDATRAYYCAARGGCPDQFLFPESYIVDGEGRLVAYVVGPRDWSGQPPRRFLRRLLGG